MNVYKISGVSELITGNPYVGRGIIIGKSEDGKSAAFAYFIMGRSANSRNRVFTEKNGEVFTKPFDLNKVEDASLIIYPAVKRFNGGVVITNGDQTDTVIDGLKKGKSFFDALTSREFEPDFPNFTPRISGIINLKKDAFDYQMSILKSADERGSACNRYLFSFSPIAGLGHFIHTYITDGNPIPTFSGEPERVKIPNGIDEFADELWHALDGDNKISLYVEYIDLKTGNCEKRLINKNK